MTTQPLMWALDGPLPGEDFRDAEPTQERVPFPAPRLPPVLVAPDTAAGSTETSTPAGTSTTTSAHPVHPVGLAATAGTLAEVMTREVVCVRPETDLATVRDILLEQALSALPVIDDERRLCGMITLRDVLRRGTDGVVDEAMMRFAFALPETAPIGQAAALMAFEGIHRLPVVRGDGRVAGIVSAIDVMRAVARAGGYLMPGYTQVQRAGGHRH